MALESRGKKSYYYRKRRVGQRVISEYVGGGMAGEFAEMSDSDDRQKADLRRRAFQELQRRDATIDKEIDDIGTQVKALVQAALLVTGYHQFKRTWRKQRGRNER